MRQFFENSSQYRFSWIIYGAIFIVTILLFFIVRISPLFAPLIFFLPALFVVLHLYHFRQIMDPIQQISEEAEIMMRNRPETEFEIPADDIFERLRFTIRQMNDDIESTQITLDNMLETVDKQMSKTETLGSQESYFRNLFKNANDAVFIYNFEGKLIDVNNKACEMLGYPYEELMLIPFLDLQVEEEVLKPKAAFKNSKETGSLRYESLMQCRDGEHILVEISSSIVDINRGLMQSVVHNISARKAMERSLRESEEKFRTFMETATDLMFISGERGQLQYVNDAMIRRLGYSKSELLKMTFHELLASESLDDSKNRRQQLIERGEDVHEFTWETKNRQKIIGEMRAVAIFDESGRFRGIRGVLRDMTDRKKIERSQRLTNLGKLAADIAHEVKNQLMLIVTRAQIAEMHHDEGKDVRNDLEIIIKQCRHSNDVVKRLLMFSKPSKPTRENTNINNTLEFVVELVEKQFLTKRVDILKKFTPGIPDVNIDEKQMQEVFVNLLQNSFEAMDEGGLITIHTSLENTHVQIDIQDNGAGMTENDLEHIFDPFYTTKEHGTGLGMSACYGIIQAHEGEIKYNSVKGEGTTASISLPVNHGSAS